MVPKFTGTKCSLVWYMFRRLGVAVLHQGRRLSTAKTPAGLVNSRSCGEFYTQKLRPEDVQVLLASGKSEKSFWAMAQLDAEEKGVSPDDYLASVHKELVDFCERKLEDGSREVWDREQLLEAVRSALATSGQFAMLLGGKSCGKSTVLRNVAGVTGVVEKGGTANIKMSTGQAGRVLCVSCARVTPPMHPPPPHPTPPCTPRLDLCSASFNAPAAARLLAGTSIAENRATT